MMRRILKPCVAVAAAAALSACVVAPYYPRGGVVAYDDRSTEGDYYDRDLADSPLAPPAPYVEVRPVAPFAGAIWVAGYWGWARDRHHWVPGRWLRPRPGYGWVPHRWAPGRGGHWVLRGGGWMRR